MLSFCNKYAKGWYWIYALLLTTWLVSSDTQAATSPTVNDASGSGKNTTNLYSEFNDEEAFASEEVVSSHLVDRQVFEIPSGNEPPNLKNYNFIHSTNLDYNTTLPKNCSYWHNDVFCDCNLELRRFICYDIHSVDDIRLAFDHLLNATRIIYWNTLEVHCADPYMNDEPIDSKQATSPPNKSFHISYEIFTEGPRFESVIFVGDCSKPKHYDNLITVDRDVQRISIMQNMLRMATSCSVLQPKFERLSELTLKDCLVAGDMISSTFSSRCLGLYGNRNEPVQLTKLIITSCNISLIESGAFYNFAELELIDLSYNQISHLSRQSFAPHLYRLRTLKLDHNKLTSLNSEFFEKLPELREVILSGNQLTTLPVLPSAGPGVAQVLHLANNPWDCRCRLTWILEEPLDSVRFITDEPKCMTPAIVKQNTLFKGLQLVQYTFC